MGEQAVLERIAAWLAAGVIDEATADRLRAAETAAEPTAAGPEVGRLRVTVGELFGYLGISFLLAAYYWGVSQVVGSVGDDGIGWAVGTGLAAGAFLVAGYVVRDRGDAVGRAAGLLLLAGGYQVFGAVAFLLGQFSSLADLQSVISALAWLAAALLARRVLASLPTQIGLLSAFIAFAWAMAAWVGPVFGTPTYIDEPPYVTGLNPLQPIAFIGWMVAAAAVVAFFGEGEARGSDVDPGALRRAVLTRFWAGMTAVVGTAFGIFGIFGGFGRALEPYLGDVILFVVCAALIVLAMRRAATAYLIPAGLGIVIGLTDLDSNYVVDEIGLGPALLVEGLALIAVGGGIEMLRRRLAARRAHFDRNERAVS